MNYTKYCIYIVLILSPWVIVIQRWAKKNTTVRCVHRLTPYCSSPTVNIHVRNTKNPLFSDNFFPVVRHKLQFKKGSLFEKYLVNIFCAVMRIHEFMLISISYEPSAIITFIFNLWLKLRCGIKSSPLSGCWQLSWSAGLMTCTCTVGVNTPKCKYTQV